MADAIRARTALISRRKRESSGPEPGPTGICRPLLLSRVGPTEGAAGSAFSGLDGKVTGAELVQLAQLGAAVQKLIWGVMWTRTRTRTRSHQFSINTDFSPKGEVTPDDVTARTGRAVT